MATNRIPALQFPEKPGPKKVPAKAVIISQAVLAEIFKAESTIKKLEAEIGPLRDAVKAQLESGLEVEPGKHDAHLKITERRNVSWKAVVEKKLGESYAERVIAATKPTESKTLVVD